mmetsp:Transcript_10885/g.31207  ORF Transcript_10885/g.31207 Transcript_10885/m.31207 type:complete len:410 (+) Transcript_10885:78-1307(+)
MLEVPWTDRLPVAVGQFHDEDVDQVGEVGSGIGVSRRSARNIVPVTVQFERIGGAGNDFVDGREEVEKFASHEWTVTIDAVVSASSCVNRGRLSIEYFDDAVVVIVAKRNNTAHGSCCCRCWWWLCGCRWCRRNSSPLGRRIGRRRHSASSTLPFLRFRFRRCGLYLFDLIVIIDTNHIVVVRIERRQTTQRTLQPMKEGQVRVRRADLLVRTGHIRLETMQGALRQRPQPLRQLAGGRRLAIQLLARVQYAFAVIADLQGAAVFGQPFPQSPGFAVLHAAQEGVLHALAALPAHSFGVRRKLADLLDGGVEILFGHETLVSLVKSLRQWRNVALVELVGRHAVPQHLVDYSLLRGSRQSLPQLLLARHQKVDARQVPRHDFVRFAFQSSDDVHTRHWFQRKAGDFDLQ